jgi:hypothetical protein
MAGCNQNRVSRLRWSPRTNPTPPLTLHRDRTTLHRCRHVVGRRRRMPQRNPTRPMDQQRARSAADRGPLALHLRRALSDCHRRTSGRCGPRMGLGTNPQRASLQRNLGPPSTEFLGGQTALLASRLRLRGPRAFGPNALGPYSVRLGPSAHYRHVDLEPADRWRARRVAVDHPCRRQVLGRFHEGKVFR